MELQNYFTIISDDSPSQFTANFVSPIRLEDGYLLGLKSIFYGEINNVNSKNYSIYISIDDTHGGNGNLTPISIKQKRYNSTGELLTEINYRVSQYLKTAYNYTGTRTTSLNYSANSDKWTIKLPPGVFFRKAHLAPNPLDLLVMKDGIYNSFETIDAPFLDEKHIGFLYCSIIENSYINSKSSRLLATIPLSSTDGTSYHEYHNPNYYRISIRDFSDINFQLCNEDGDLIEFNNGAKIVLNLHMKKTGI